MCFLFQKNCKNSLGFCNRQLCLFSILKIKIFSWLFHSFVRNVRANNENDSVRLPVSYLLFKMVVIPFGKVMGVEIGAELHNILLKYLFYTFLGVAEVFVDGISRALSSGNMLEELFGFYSDNNGNVQTGFNNNSSVFIITSSFLG